MRALAHQCFGPTGGSIPPATREVTASLTNKQQTFHRMFHGSGGREKSSRSAGFMAIAIFSEHKESAPRSQDFSVAFRPSNRRLRASVLRLLAMGARARVQPLNYNRQLMKMQHPAHR